jgi:peptide deformylase
MLKIITFGNELLRQISLPVKEFDEDLHDFIRQMHQTLLKRKGFGLAAVQVGQLLRLFIVELPEDKLRIFINPEIIETSMDQNTFEEGCLSVPGINTDIIRPMAIKVQAWDENGKPFTISAKGLLARVMQHEIDHLNGMLFIDHLNTDLKDRLLKLYKNHQKVF